MVLLSLSPLSSRSPALSSNGILSHGSPCRLSSPPKSNFKKSTCNYTEQNGLHASRNQGSKKDCPRPFGCFTYNLGQLFSHFRTFGGDEME